jgi:hypothetical protein
LVFKLGGKTKLPEPTITSINVPQPPDLESPEQIAQRETLYHMYCSVCRGPGPACYRPALHGAAHA